MDAVEYIKALRRLCKMQKICNGCPLRDNCDCIADLCDGASCDEAEKGVQIVEKWAKDHPVKTRQIEFLKMFPNAKTMGGVIVICPNYIDSAYRNVEYCDHSFCEECCKKYWSEEVDK